MEVREYLSDPCGASSLPFWKAESQAVPEGITIVRDDVFSAGIYGGRDERYFRMIHDLSSVKSVPLPEGFRMVYPDAVDLAMHINSCYGSENITPEELRSYKEHSVYDPELWIAVEDVNSGKIAASGIAELDCRIGEGVLEWIQVSPGLRGRGLGSFVVCELLRRMHGKADFVTVSGKMDSESRPLELYRYCGFSGVVIWHVITGS